MVRITCEAGRRLASDLPFSMPRLLTNASRWLLLFSVVYAPWAFGCTRAWTIDLLNGLLGTAIGLWLIDCLVRRVRPRVPVVCAGCVGLLLVQGWGMAGNAHWFFDPDYFRFVPVEAWWKAGPGSIDQAISSRIMVRLSALLGAFCLASDLSHHPLWRRRLWWTITLTGTSLVIFGLVQKFAGVPLLPFENLRPGSLYFATYFYHGNAGSFINLVLPLAVGLAAVAVRKSAPSHIFLVPCAVIIAAGAFANSSRAAAVVTLILLGTLAAWQLRVWRRELREIPRRIAATYLTVALILLSILAVAVLPTARWATLPGQLNTENPRWISLQVLLRMVPDAGLGGFGPGTFAAAFPRYTQDLGASIPGVWRFAHQDYLQTLIEWGAIGATFWAILVLGGLISCFQSCRQARSSESALLFTSGLALAGVSLHAFIDFPLQIASLQLYVAIYLGLGWGSRTWPVEGGSGTQKP
jgi:O-antigen ligase